MSYNIFRPLWAYRGFILGNVKRDFQLKYRNSILGAAWTVVHPLAMILIYTIVFTEVMKARIPGVDSTFGYSIYLCAGILTWGMFAEITTRTQNIFIENANLLKKISFPRLCLPVIVICNALINFAIIFTIFIAFLIITGNFPGLAVLATIPLLTIQIVFSIGLGITLAVFNVFFRDVGQFYNIFLQFWFWLTPIVYPINVIPDYLKTLLHINPMADLISAYQGIFLNNKFPDWQELWLITLIATLLCIMGYALFKKRVGEIVDEL